MVRSCAPNRHWAGPKSPRATQQRRFQPGGSGGSLPDPSEAALLRGVIRAGSRSFTDWSLFRVLELENSALVHAEP
jgi:hypothetical protein